MSENHRQRTISWQDPMVTAHMAMEMNGLEYVQAMIRGEVPPPPISAAINMWLVEADKGRAVFAAEPGEFHYNPIGSVHGGFAATLLDSALGCAIHTTLEKGTTYTTLQLNINYLRAITARTGVVRSEGKVLHRGRRMATAEAYLIDGNERMLAHGTTTCMILPVSDE